LEKKKGLETAPIKMNPMKVFQKGQWKWPCYKKKGKIWEQKIGQKTGGAHQN